MNAKGVDLLGLHTLPYYIHGQLMGPEVKSVTRLLSQAPTHSRMGPDDIPAVLEQLISTRPKNIVCG
jgi:hypothetical protein